MLILGDYKTMKNTTPVEEHEYPPLRMFQILFVDFFREGGGVPQICQMISTKKIRKGRGNWPGHFGMSVVIFFKL